MLVQRGAEGAGVILWPLPCVVLVAGSPLIRLRVKTRATPTSPTAPTITASPWGAS